MIKQKPAILISRYQVSGRIKGFLGIYKLDLTNLKVISLVDLMDVQIRKGD